MRANGARSVLLLVACAATLCAGLFALGPKVLVYPDAMEYADMARGLVRGDGLLDRAVLVHQLALLPDVPSPSLRRAPGFPVFESLVFRVAGASDRSAIAASALLLFLGSLVIGGFARGQLVDPTRRAGLGGAAAVGALYLADPWTAHYALSGLSEPLFTAAVVAAVWALLARPFPAQWLVVGIAVGACQYVRLNGFTLVLPVLVACLVLDPGRAPRRGALILCGLAAALLPFFVRNLLGFGSASPVGMSHGIIYNEIGEYGPRAMQRAMHLTPGAGPDLAWLLDGHLDELGAKFRRNLAYNWLALRTAASPVLWLPVAVAVAWRWRQLAPRTRALAALVGTLAPLWLVLFSLGEPEDPRFFVPLAPLIATLAVAIFIDVGRASTLGAAWRAAIAAVLVTAALAPGWRTLWPSFQSESDGSDRMIAELFARETPADAVVMSVLPWTVAWYGDRPALWLPATVDEVQSVATRARATHLFLTPVVAQLPELEARWLEAFEGSEAPEGWRELDAGALRGHVRLYALPAAWESEG